MLSRLNKEGKASKAGLSTQRALPRTVWAEQGVDKLHRYKIWSRRAVQQTGKGKIDRVATMYIIGDGNGLVGWGQGKHEQSATAAERAFRDGIVSMDRVERFETRTIWHEIRIKFGATEVILRPRPLGFGLKAGPVMHQVCKAAGIKDISGKIMGSRNPMNVVKATCLALWSGQARPGMGDGVGGRGRRLEKGQGVRSRQDIERARGRRLLEL
ncbi:ribosomal protein S5 domain 2-like protein [Calocera viscosa TUFC12733]|uniref:Ribosomal protein S5 domain 2-like protein n=1 Tax=Calocera viscosa (strain TUFC12733) TaxID=1330018 RepID=A0A167K1N1_CALVF|nr:ribosomal protein S5 domain 2-like protein [Calocera viscosa TUFC12733]